VRLRVAVVVSTTDTAFESMFGTHRSVPIIVEASGFWPTGTDPVI